jgi:hypothetical protein
VSSAADSLGLRAACCCIISASVVPPQVEPRHKRSFEVVRELCALSLLQLVMMQQDERASRPRLSVADDTVLKLVLRALGEGHYLTPSLVCTAWRHACSTSLQQSKLTCCRPYVQDAAMWAHIKELGLCERIPTDLIGQYGCESAVADRLGSAFDKMTPRQEPAPEPAVALSSLPWTKEIRGIQLYDQSGSLVFQTDDVNTVKTFSSQDIEHMKTLDDSAKLQFVALRRQELAAAGKAAVKEAARSAKIESQRIAKLESTCLTDTILPIVTGAAKGGRYAVCSSTLAKLLRRVLTAYGVLLPSIVSALAECAAKCKDVTSFNLVFRALLVVSLAAVPIEVDVAATRSIDSGSESAVNHQLNRWHVAVLCNEQCDAALPLQQFAKLLYLQLEDLRGNRTSPITADQDACATTAAVTMLHRMWEFHDIEGALTWALARYGLPLLCVHFIKQCEKQQQSAVAEELVHKLAQKGRIDVLDHLLENGVLSNNNAVVVEINDGAIDGDRVAVFKWLRSHGLLLDDVRERVMPCHRKLIAYFTELDTAAAAAAAAE